MRTSLVGPPRPLAFFFLFSLGLWFQPVAAQAQLFHQKISDDDGQFVGTLDDDDQFGHGVAALGDVDGDGIEDLAVGAIGDDDGGPSRGAVWILFMNVDGTVKGHQKISDTQGSFLGVLDDGDVFGASVGALGDLDGDRIPDLAVGARGDDDGGANRGAVWVLFLQANGRVKGFQKLSATEGGLTGPLADHAEFGNAVASLDDVDGDGVIDLAVGAHRTPDGLSGSEGAVWVLFLNPDGTVKSEQPIGEGQGGFTESLEAFDLFGTDVTGLGDLNGDGVRDLAATARGYDDTGSIDGAVWVLFLNPDGTVASQQRISESAGGITGLRAVDDGFGHSVESLGDLDGDGVTDLAVGASLDDDGAADSDPFPDTAQRGAVWVFYLNSDGTVKGHQKISDTAGGFTGELDDEDQFGTSLTTLQDLDGDGTPELVVGAIGDDDDGGTSGGARGAVWVLYNPRWAHIGGTPAQLDFALEGPGEMASQGISLDNLGTKTLDWAASTTGFLLPATMSSLARGPAGAMPPPARRPAHRAPDASRTARALDALDAKGVADLRALQTRSSMLFFDDMESGFGHWTTELYNGTTDDLWHLSDLTAVSPTMSMWPGVDIQGNYVTLNRISTAAVSPPIDLTAISDPVWVFFMENLDTEPGWDFAMVDVSTDGGATWTALRGTAHDGTAPSGTSGGWVLSGYDLSAYVGQTIQLRFFFETLDGLNNFFPGWFVDDVWVASGLPYGHLTMTPSAGLTPPDESTPATVTVESGQLPSGDYAGELLVQSNDLDDPLVTVPVSVSVGGTVSVLSPNGAEAWTAGSTVTILWEGNLSDAVNIQLLKNGVFDRTIAASTPSDGSFDYAIPASLAPGSDYTVRIRSVLDPGISDDSDAPFEVLESIVVTSPPPGTMWEAGTTQNVTWTSNVPAEPVRILLFKGGVFEQTIEVSTPNDGFAFFPIATTLEPGLDYTVRVRLVSDATVRGDSEPFEIIHTDTIEVLAPNGGETWTAGTLQTIAWTDNFAANVRILLFREGVLQQTIVASTPSDGSYSWSLPPDLLAETGYRVRVRKVDNALVRDNSDGTFEVVSALAAPQLVTAAAKGAPGKPGAGPEGVQWNPVRGASAYRLEVASDTSFAAPLLAVMLGPDVQQFAVQEALREADGLPAQRKGPFWVRVRAESGSTQSGWAQAEVGAAIPTAFVLESNYPNPFNPATTLRYALKEAADVQLMVYDAVGREVAHLVQSRQAAGRYAYRFEASHLASGVYYYRIVAVFPNGTFEQIRPMLLVK